MAMMFAGLATVIALAAVYLAGNSLRKSEDLIHEVIEQGRRERTAIVQETETLISELRERLRSIENKADAALKVRGEMITKVAEIEAEISALKSTVVTLDKSVPERNGVHAS